MIFFFFNDTATTEIYTLSLHDALPISGERQQPVIGSLHLLRQLHHQQYCRRAELGAAWYRLQRSAAFDGRARSEEHTSELQSRQYLVCRLLLEKKKNSLTRSLPSNSYL